MLNNLGFPSVRVRHFGDLAKIESPVSEIERLQSLFLLIESSLKGIGFKKVEIDKEGLVSGKLNRAISSNG